MYFLAEKIYGQNVQKFNIMSVTILCYQVSFSIEMILLTEVSLRPQYFQFLCYSKVIVNCVHWYLQIAFSFSIPWLHLLVCHINSQDMKTVYQKVTNIYNTYPLALARHSICRVTTVGRQNTYAYSTSQNKAKMLVKFKGKGM